MRHSLTDLDLDKKTAICSVCGPVKVETFTLKGRLRAACSVRRKATKSRLRKEKMAFVSQYKLEHGCAHCGYNEHPRALDFHHPNPADKLDSMKELIDNDRSWYLIKREIEKCIVLCSNCHRVLHSSY